MLLGVLVLALAACGGGTGSGDGAGDDHNAADVTFATAMIPHHAQGMAMAKLAATRSGSSKLTQLAVQISAEQPPEIYQMQSLLADWGSPAAPADGTSGMAGMPGMGLGMMTDAQLAQLTAATGPAFDRLFLQRMSAHDQGGIALARTERADGGNADATTLAQNIDDAQEYAVPLLQQLLAGR